MCRILFIVILNIIMLSVAMLSVIMLSVVVPSRSNPLNETHYFKIILDFKITEITL